jgi:methylmalonyl-CoA mutase
MIAGPINLNSAFPPAGEADWRAIAEKAGGIDQPPRSDDGIAVGPIYPRRKDSGSVLRPSAGRPWSVVQRVDANDAKAAAMAITEEISGGADGVMLTLSDSFHPIGGRLSAVDNSVIFAALKAVGAEGKRFMLDAGRKSTPVAALLLSDEVFFGAIPDLIWDPVAAVAFERFGADEVASLISATADLGATLDARGVDGRVVHADGRLWHAAGASEAQELAATLATFVTLLRLLEDHGIAPDRAAARIGVALAADSDQFLTIAKFRAMRLLAARALEETGVEVAVPLHAETAWRMMSRREPRMNVLRTTGAALAAAIGGADSITVLPFDALDGSPSAAARRLARNTQLILAEESQLFRFADPAAGSGAVESLTDSLAGQAWDRFRAIEKAGGMLAEIATGTFRQEVAAMRDARLARVAAGEIEMIGANVFRAPDVAPVATPAAASDDGPLAFRRLTETVEAAP